MFAKVMSIPDELLTEWFELLTDRPANEIPALVANPMAAKKQLGKDIIAFYHGAAAAAEAESEWIRRFSERQDPTDMPDHMLAAADLADGKIPICKVLVASGLAKGTNDARRLIQGGGVNFGPTAIVSDPTLPPVEDGLVLRVGVDGQSNCSYLVHLQVFDFGLESASASLAGEYYTIHPPFSLLLACSLPSPTDVGLADVNSEPPTSVKIGTHKLHASTS